MKLPVICLILLPVYAFSQDLIVTVGGDSINCKIFKIGEERIFFHDNRPAINKNASLSVKYVKIFKYKYYYGKHDDEPNLSNQSASENPYPLTGIPYFPGWQIRFLGGGSRLIENADASIHPVLYAYYEELRSGFHLGASLEKFFTEKTALGLRSNLFFTSNTLDSVWIQQQGQPKTYGIMRDDITVFYLGPEISFLFYRSDFKPLKFHLDFSLGFIAYNDKGEFVIPINEEGYGMGFNGEFGVDYYMTDKFAFGFYFTYSPIRINKLYISAMGQRKQIQLEPENNDDLSRFDFGVSIKFLR